MTFALQRCRGAETWAHVGTTSLNEVPGVSACSDNAIAYLEVRRHCPHTFDEGTEYRLTEGFTLFRLIHTRQRIYQDVFVPV